MGKKSRERNTGMTEEERIRAAKLSHPAGTFANYMAKTRGEFERWVMRRRGLAPEEPKKIYSHTRD